MAPHQKRFEVKEVTTHAALDDERKTDISFQEPSLYGHSESTTNETHNSVISFQPNGRKRDT